MINIYIQNLGCPKNEVDGQYYAGLIEEIAEVKIVDDYKKSSIIIVNTCGFIEDARKESIEAIWEAVELKKSGACEKVVVTGCLSQRYHDELKEQIPELDGIFGVGDYDSFKDFIKKILAGEEISLISEPEQKLNQRLPRKKREGSFAYLKIADGCSKNCSYCAIPIIKGDYRSRDKSLIIEEAEKILSDGISELILIAQDTTQYGIDLDADYGTVALLKELLKLDGLEWLRLMYTYLDQIDRELIELMAAADNFCSYLDLPIQHVAENVRNRMNRPGGSRYVLDKIEMIRSINPETALRTTLMVGFPGETEEDFAELKNFVREVKFDKLGVFSYSQEEGTDAAEMSGQIPEEIRRRRENELTEIQEEIAHQKNQELVGKTLPLMIDKLGDGEFIGRTEYDAPGIDNSVRGPIPADDQELSAGEIVKCQIKSAYKYDITGEIVNEFSQ
ncbi:30S ribosomal protein S12 methylthiotransferase RimO [Halarsenatibacter silvermanii]|uniref:Ribosomal protein uS12 methylthiotransferase RimO n=1 Tax=Halarsenatibacter silvermanii TaxID=321763 RepID=A0A1G9LLV5_9FIRM|nr:30S ribosomal protein S12 methylthiotransferase RimO [Halarsenatibacter silvermanii]SDL62999.1 SSU ribosomal protein S12P methylthiotransferase [Halarsenatibacter silvermanii]